MHTDESILPNSHKIKCVAVGFPCLLVLSVLSIGPVARLEDAGMIGEGVNKLLHIIYAPLRLLSDIPGMRQFFNWYAFHVWNCDTLGDNTL